MHPGTSSRRQHRGVSWRSSPGGDTSFPSLSSALGNHRVRVQPPRRIRDTQSEMPSYLFLRVPSTCHLKYQALSHSGGTWQTQPPKAIQSIFILPMADPSPKACVCPSCRAGNEQCHFYKRLPDFTDGDKSHEHSICT